MPQPLLTPNAVFEVVDEELAGIPPAQLAQALCAMRDRLESAVATLDVASAMLGLERRNHPLAAQLTDAADELRPWTSLEWDAHAGLLAASSPSRVTS
jgi:hypothetical protein